MITRTWEALDWKATETNCWQTLEDGHHISGTIIGVVEDTAVAIHYQLGLGPDWLPTILSIHDLVNPHNKIELSTDKNGRWSDGIETLHALDGCLYVDISLTPFTNTLPVRKLDLPVGKRQAIETVYIRVPEFRIERDEQYYTRESATVYKFESKLTNFCAHIEVDENGFVLEYEGLFKQVFPNARNNSRF